MITFIIASISKDYLDSVIESIIKDCPHQLEVIVVSPYPIDIPKITWIKDENCDGSCSAFNLGASHSSGEYIAIGTDDTLMIEGWWECADILKDNPTLCSFRTGNASGVNIPHTFCVARQFYEGDFLKKNIFNPALFHMYLDVDLGIAMHEAKIQFSTCHKTQTLPEKEDKDKMNQKNKFYPLDGMIFNGMWHKKYPPCPFSEKELEKTVEIQLNKNIFKEYN